MSITHEPLTVRQTREELTRLAYVSRDFFWSTAKDEAFDLSPLGPAEFDTWWSELIDKLTKRDDLEAGRIAWWDAAPHIRGRSEEECEDLAARDVATRVALALDALTGGAR